MDHGGVASESMYMSLARIFKVNKRLDQQGFSGCCGDGK
jgi:hypothetical protein